MPLLLLLLQLLLLLLLLRMLETVVLSCAIAVVSFLLLHLCRLFH